MWECAVWNHGACVNPVHRDTQSTVLTWGTGRCRRALVAERKCKVKEDQVRLLRHDKLAITAADTAPEKLASLLQGILHSIPDVVVGGIATVGRAVIQTNDINGRAPLRHFPVHSCVG